MLVLWDFLWDTPSGYVKDSELEHGPVEIVDFPTENRDFL